MIKRKLNLFLSVLLPIPFVSLYSHGTEEPSSSDAPALKYPSSLSLTKMLMRVRGKFVHVSSSFAQIVICLHVNVRNVCISMGEQVCVGREQSRSCVSLQMTAQNSPVCPPPTSTPPYFLLFPSFRCLLQHYWEAEPVWPSLMRLVFARHLFSPTTYSFIPRRARVILTGAARKQTSAAISRHVVTRSPTAGACAARLGSF